MYLRSALLFIIGFLSLACASAQQVFTVHGLVTKSKTGERVSQVIVHDQRSGDMMMSDELGIFTIKAAAGDTLIIEKKEYGTQKIVVSNGNDLVVSMQPVIELSTVTVKGQSTKSEMKDVMSGYKQDGIFNNGNSLPFWQFLNSPITGLYNLFGSEPKAARHFAAYTKEELQAEAVDKRYNLVFVKQVTGATDDEAKAFMQYYVPSYDDIKIWSDYDLARQVKKQYDYFEANKKRIDHRDLPALPPQPPADN
jgi:hypothetical protein